MSVTIQHNISLLPYNTFQIDCVAQDFCAVKTPKDIQELISQWVLNASNTVLILWGGSNILLMEETFDGLVIKNEILWREIIEETDTTVTVKIWAGENRNDIVHRAIGQGRAGCENLVSIPWSVWAAPMQNIGAYWIEVASLIDTVEAIDRTTWALITITNEQCQFGYRDSIFKQALKDTVIITAVTFTFTKWSPDYEPILSYGAVATQLTGKEPTPQAIASAVAAIRAEKLPDWKTIGTAGSFFKNPIIDNDTAQAVLQKHPDLVTFDAWPWQTKFSAGQLIDQAWCKGITQWSVGTYQNHALVLVNHGWGTGQELVALAKQIQSTVLEQFGIMLEPEVQLIS